MKIDFHGHNPSSSQADLFIYCHAHPSKPLPQTLGDSPFCFGLHPWYLPETWEQALIHLEEWAKHPQFFSLGECGLDRLKGKPLNEQKDFFTKQLIWASEKNLPFVVIHSVRTNPECWGIIKNSPFRGKVVFHDYKDNADFTRQLLRDYRVFLSLGTALDGKGQFLKTYPSLTNAEKESLHKRLLLETDDTSQSITERYTQVSQHFGKSVAQWERIIEANYNELSH